MSDEKKTVADAMRTLANRVEEGEFGDDKVDTDALMDAVNDEVFPLQ